jgi:hypothetical protein
MTASPPRGRFHGLSFWTADSMYGADGTDSAEARAMWRASATGGGVTQTPLSVFHSRFSIQRTLSSVN